MTEIERLKHLKLALRIVGVIAIFGFYPLTVFWPSGWAWSSGRSEYLEMIIAIYATLGVFLLIAARNPNHDCAGQTGFASLAAKFLRVSSRAKFSKEIRWA